MSGKEQSVLVSAGVRLVLPQHFRPTRNTPPQPPLELIRAPGYADVFNLAYDDGYEPASDAVIQLQGRIKAATESALMSILTDWRRHTRSTTQYRREITDGNARRIDQVQGGSLTWAHPDGLPSEFADVLITLIKVRADGLSDLTPAG